MYEDRNMRPVETIPGIGGGMIKENDGVGKFNYDILQEHFLLFIHLFICTYIVWATSPHFSPPFYFPQPTLLPGRTCSALFSNTVEEKT
jgi:hypothetical protein